MQTVEHVYFWKDGKYSFSKARGCSNCACAELQFSSLDNEWVLELESDFYPSGYYVKFCPRCGVELSPPDLSGHFEIYPTRGYDEGTATDYSAKVTLEKLPDGVYKVTEIEFGELASDALKQIQQGDTITIRDENLKSAMRVSKGTRKKAEMNFPSEGIWCWVKIGNNWFPAKRDSTRAGGWSNDDTWEDFGNEVTDFEIITPPNNAQLIVYAGLDLNGQAKLFNANSRVITHAEWIKILAELNAVPGEMLRVTLWREDENLKSEIQTLIAQAQITNNQ